MQRTAKIGVVILSLMRGRVRERKMVAANCHTGGCGSLAKYGDASFARMVGLDE
jgi:hypothetical protein